MEQARLFLAIALSFLVFFVWEFFIVDREPVQKPDKMTQSEQMPEDYPKEDPYIKEPVADTAFPSSAEEILPSAQESRIITVNSPLYSVKISEKGSVFQSFILKDYREKKEKDSPPKEMIPKSIRTGTIRTGFAGNSLPGLEEAMFSANTEADAVDVFSQTETLSFSWRTPEGIVVEKTFHFSPETYLIGLTVTIKNGSYETLEGNLILSLAGVVPEKSDSYSFEGPSALINDSVEEVAIKNIEDKKKYDGTLKWIGIEDRYFLSSIIPVMPVESSMRLLLKDKKVFENQYMHSASNIRPETQQRFEFNLFLGPKSLHILSSLNNDLDKAIDFGWFDVIAKPCLLIMNFLYASFIPNYGIAIIILTTFIKLILWPLGSKSYKSMNEMKKIQPLMTEIREKYKDDKKMMNQELMNLYKTYKINPMGGCLPMILQIPVFIAFYRMLYEAIELRHAPFLLWIDDLSAPDRLLHFSFSIPFMEPPYGIPVLTIVMGGTMLLQQRMSPPPGDPAQAKIMMFMPIVFTVIFINFSSGLVLYWLVNNVLSISQQYYISKKKNA